MFNSIQNFLAKNLLAKKQLKETIATVEKAKKESTPIGVGERVEGQMTPVMDNQTQQQETNSIELAAKNNNALAEREFVKVEKNLVGLGFFSASTKRTKSLSKKVVKGSTVIEGKRTDVLTKIVPSTEYGLPGVAEQDTFFGILKICNDLSRQQGKLVNPVPFTYAELLGIQGKSKKSGFHYQELEKQLKSIRATTIEGSLYVAETGDYVTDIFGIIERIIMFGKKMPDGSIADKNYVWLSQWFLENIANNYLLPIDYDTYKKLKNHIAKALVPVLQIWLYASRDEGKFEKLYSDICEHLGITCYTKLSDIQRRFCPSLDELKKEGYLSKWHLVQTADKKGYKIVFYHGSKFYTDRIKRLERKQKSLEPASPKKQTELVIDLTPEPQPAATPPTPATGESKPIPQPTVQTQPETPQISPQNEPQQHDNPPSGIQLFPDQQNALYRLVNDFSVSNQKALELVTTKLNQTLDQLEAFKYRYPKEEKAPNNKAGLIITAIEQNYDLPEPYLADKREQEQKRKNEVAKKILSACTICNGQSFVRYTQMETKQTGLKPCLHTEEHRQEILAINQAGKIRVTTIDYQPINLVLGCFCISPEKD